MELDGDYMLGWGENRPLQVAVDLGEGQPVAVGYVDERDLQAVQLWLESGVQRIKATVIMVDDLAMYKVEQRLNLDHQICQFHPCKLLLPKMVCVSFFRERGKIMGKSKRGGEMDGERIKKGWQEKSK
jgi:hypothetical protein